LRKEIILLSSLNAKLKKITGEKLWKWKIPFKYSRS